MQKTILFTVAAALLAGPAHAQTRPAGKATPKSTAHPAKAPAKRAAGPTAKAAPKPAPTPRTAPPTPTPTPTAEPATTQAPSHSVLSMQKLADRSFIKGSNALNLGIGFGMGYGYGLGRNMSQTPALSVSYLRGVAEAGPGTISVGGMVGYKGISWKDGSGGASATWRNVYVGARGAYHYGFHNPRLDTYAGLGLGLRVVSYSSSYDTVGGASGSQAELSGFVGARYFFSDKIGAFSELGYDMSYFKVGLSARF